MTKFAVSGRGHGRKGERNASRSISDPAPTGGVPATNDDDESPTTSRSDDDGGVGHESSKEEKEEEESSSKDLKNLAKKFLNRKSKPRKSGCCPTEQQSTTNDGSTSCACPSDSDDHPHDHRHEHQHIHNAPADAPSDLAAQLAAAPAISCLILGDSGVGKTSFLNMHMTGKFLEAYQPTDTVGVAQLLFATNFGWLKIHTIDTAPASEDGHKLGGLDESYVKDVQSVMILFDVTNPKSYKNATKKWLKEANSIRPDIPKVLVGNKCDLFQQRKIHKHDVTFHKNKQKINSQHYCDVSVKIMGNIGDPFLWLIHTLTGNTDIQFVTSPAEMTNSLLSVEAPQKNPHGVS